MTLPTQEELEDLMPHRPPMRWIRSLAECADSHAVATARFEEGDLALVDGRMLEVTLVECAAQAVAAALAWRSRAESDARAADGTLAGVSGFRVFGLPPVGTELRIDVRERQSFGRLRMVHAVITADGRRVAEGGISVHA